MPSGRPVALVRMAELQKPRRPIRGSARVPDLLQSSFATRPTRTSHAFAPPASDFSFGVVHVKRRDEPPPCDTRHHVSPMLAPVGLRKAPGVAVAAVGQSSGKVRPTVRQSAAELGRREGRSLGRPTDGRDLHRRFARPACAPDALGRFPYGISRSYESRSYAVVFDRRLVSGHSKLRTSLVKTRH